MNIEKLRSKRKAAVERAIQRTLADSRGEDVRFNGIYVYFWCGGSHVKMTVTEAHNALPDGLKRYVRAKKVWVNNL